MTPAKPRTKTTSEKEDLKTSKTKDSKSKKPQGLPATLHVTPDGDKRASPKSEDFELTFGGTWWVFQTDPPLPNTVVFTIRKNKKHGLDEDLWTDVSHGTRKRQGHVGPELKFVSNVRGYKNKFVLRVTAE